MIFQILNERSFWNSIFFAIILLPIMIIAFGSVLYKNFTAKFWVITFISFLCVLLSCIDSLLSGFIFYSNLDELVHYPLRNNGWIFFILTIGGTASLLIGILFFGIIGGKTLLSLQRKIINDSKRKAFDHMLYLLVGVNTVIHLVLYYFLYHFLEGIYYILSFMLPYALGLIE